MVQKININIISTFNVKPAVGLVLLPILHKLHDLAAPGAWQHQVKIKNKHSLEKDKDKKCRESTCVVEFAGFEDESELLRFVDSADPAVRWEVERSSVFQPPGLLTDMFWGH